MKTLKTIQTLSKIGRILSKIVFICCIVGFCGCVVGIVSLALGVETLKLGDVTIHSVIEKEAGMNMPTMYATIAVGMILCAAEAVLSKFAEVYFRNELADGTPFTMRGAKELMRLGILAIAIPFCAMLVCVIGVAVAEAVNSDIQSVSPGDYFSAGLGIMMIVMSLVCRYGAELTEGKTEA